LAEDKYEYDILMKQFINLQKLHDEQKKIIARLQQKILDLEQENKDLRLDKADIYDNNPT